MKKLTISRKLSLTLHLRLSYRHKVRGLLRVTETPRALSPFSLHRLPARSACEHRPAKSLSARKPEAASTRAGYPSTLHPAHHRPGRTASRRRCGAAFRTNSLQPPRRFPSKASQRGEGCPRRRAPDAARARHFRPVREAGEATGSRQARARVLGRPGCRAGL